MSADSEIVPLGKYKGKPVEDLLADSQYVDWLASQAWVKDRYPAFYQVIINNGAPQETPEHNAFQAQFLDDELCTALAYLALDGESLVERWVLQQVNKKKLRQLVERYGEDAFDKVDRPLTFTRNFEERGWDVVLAVVSQETSLWAKDVNMELSPGDRGSSRCYRDPLSKEIEERFWDFTDVRYAPRYTLCLELKPLLGDDYPTVLRQMKRNLRRIDSSCYNALLVVRSYSFEQVSLEQVRKLFASEDINLVLESELLKAKDDLHELEEKMAIAERERASTVSTDDELWGTGKDCV